MNNGGIYPMHHPVDRNGKPVHVGSRVRLLSLSGDWFDSLPSDERADVESMIGEEFEVEEIDPCGQPWVRKSWPDEAEGKCKSHSVALEPGEFTLVER
jgi:hypothetical protein